jgi:hypothetical protein
MSVNLQDIFDKVANHLLTQNRSSLDNEGMECVYRACNGDKCAVGCLIADEHYHAKLEGEPASDAWVIEALSKSLNFLPEELNFYSPIGRLLSELQHAHDYCDPEEWPADLVRMAHLFKLEYRGEQYGKQPVGL